MTEDRTPVGVIGYGAIGRSLVASLLQAGEAGRVALLVKPKHRERVLAEAPPAVAVFDECDAFLATRPRVVIEAAGASAVAELGEAALAADADLVIASAAALTDDTLFARLAAAAEKAGRQAVVASGAIGALDALAAMAVAGLTAVTYRGVKPPAAWRGTPAEEACDLENLRAPAVFFTGSAREAARRFPKNANVAALVGLAGLGLDATTVELVADPLAKANRHEVAAEGSTGKMRFQVEGLAARGNARTSATTAFSLLEAARSRHSPIVIGTPRSRS